MKKYLIRTGKVFVFYLLIQFIAAFFGIICQLYLAGFLVGNILSALAVIIVIAIGNLILKKWIDESIIKIQVVLLLIALSVFTALMVKDNGNINGRIVIDAAIAIPPYALLIGVMSLMKKTILGFAYGFMGLIVSIAFEMILIGKKIFSKKTFVPLLTILVVFTMVDGYLYSNRDEIKYSGHGFKYMHGYSSTDFTDYTVYAKNSKLVTLNHTADLQITEQMPIMDGAEACYPLYASIAKAVYVGIEDIERDALNSSYDYENGKIVTFTNSVSGFYRLVEKEIDLFFGARPSKTQLEYAQKSGVEVVVTPIGKEGFVFFVEADNPVDSLTIEQLKDIYSGKITNWSEVGGKNQEIIAFQRPEGSGSQTMMQYFMADTELKQPQTYETISSMGEIIENVAQYNNEDGAIGYTFRYFLEGLNQEKNVKILQIEGISPTRENISNGSYPLTTNLCLMTLKGNDNPNVKKMIEFILSEDGQYLVEETGYGKLPQ